MPEKHLMKFNNNRRYNSFVGYFKEKYGSRLQKIVIDAGFTCPNRDGTAGLGGCTYCDNEAFHPSYSTPDKTILLQIEEGIKFHKNRYRKASQYLAYFQPFSNTYAPIDVLESKFTEAINHKDIVALSVATRPDCVDDNVLKLLEKLNKIKPVWVELGLQTIKESSVDYIRRGYENSVYVDTATKLRNIGIEVITHIILGLPNEVVSAPNFNFPVAITLS